MELKDAITGMLDARKCLRSRQGVTDPVYISEQMQRLAQYTGAVEEHLGQLEEAIEVMMTTKFINEAKNSSVNQAEKKARFETGETKGQIAKLKRYVNSSWSLVSTAQSRWNHLQKDIAGQI